MGRRGRLLLRPAAAPRRQRHAAQGALAGGPPPAVRHHGDRGVAAGTRPAGAGSHPGTAAPDARTFGDHAPYRPGSSRGSRAGDDRVAQSGAAPPDPREDARRERVPEPLRHPLAFQVPRAAPVRPPRQRSGAPGGLSAGRIEYRHVRRQLQLAGAGLDAGERPPHSGTPELLLVPWRQLQDRMPHRFRQDDEPLRGGQGDLGPACRDLPAGCAGTAACLRGNGEIPGRPALARPHPVLRVLPWGQGRGPRCESPDGMDRIGGEADPAVRIARREAVA